MRSTTQAPKTFQDSQVFVYSLTTSNNGSNNLPDYMLFRVCVINPNVNIRPVGKLVHNLANVIKIQVHMERVRMSRRDISN